MNVLVTAKAARYGTAFVEPIIFTNG